MGIDDRILVVGASCRAVAWSAYRTGKKVVLLDLFVDRDLPPGCEAYAIEDFPYSIPWQAALLKPSQIVLAGGMENHPEIVDELAQLSPQLQVTGIQLSALRSIQNWQDWCFRFGSGCDIRFPKFIDDVALMQKHLGDAAWLWKPRNGAGGIKIRSMDQMAENDLATGYLQPRLDGLTLGISLLSDDHGVRFLGGMQSLGSHETSYALNPSFAPKSNWAYTGSCGPIETPTALQAAFTALGQRIVTETKYHGLIQMDILIDQHQKFYLLDINPRWTASMELIELATGLNLVDLLFNSGTGNLLRTESFMRFFKWILYATEDLEVSQALSETMFQKAWSRWPRMIDEQPLWGWADIPRPKTLIRAGEPFATLIGRQPSSGLRHRFFATEDWSWLAAKSYNLF